MQDFIRTSLIGAAFAMALSAPASAQTNWDMATPYGDNNFHTQNIAAFADEIREATNGSLNITVHSANSLFGHAEIKDAVRDGLVPMGEIFLSRLANEDPIFELDGIPFLASSYDEAKALWEASRDVVTAKFAEQGMTVLYSVAWPGQSLYLRREVTDPAQFQGMNFRVPNVTTERLAVLLGATPTQTEETDVPTAFSTGRVDAMITSPSTGANNKAWDYTTHYIDVRGWMPKNIVFVNTDAFESLTEEEREAVRKAAATAEERGWQMSVEENDTKIAELEAGGMIVSKPTEAVAAKLREIGEIMTNEWMERAGDDGKAILDSYRNQ
jgi:TRAP-type C4-dicarboxylate transport system substrate-binding protein